MYQQSIEVGNWDKYYQQLCWNFFNISFSFICAYHGVSEDNTQGINMKEYMIYICIGFTMYF